MKSNQASIEKLYNLYTEMKESAEFKPTIQVKKKALGSQAVQAEPLTQPKVHWADKVLVKNFKKAITTREILKIRKKANSVCPIPGKSILKKSVKEVIDYEETECSTTFDHQEFVYQRDDPKERNSSELEISPLKSVSTQTETRISPPKPKRRCQIKRTCFRQDNWKTIDSSPKKSSILVQHKLSQI